jgi:hypothetical protein
MPIFRFEAATRWALQLLITKEQKAIWIIFHAKYNAHTESLVKTKKLHNLPDLIIFELQFVQ